MKKVFNIVSIICFCLCFGLNSRADSPKIVAEVNGKKITLSEFNEIALAQGRNDRENLLNQIIASLLLAEEAKKSGLDKDPTVQQQLKMISEHQLGAFFYQKKIIEKTKISDKEIDKLLPDYERKKIRFRQIVANSLQDAQQMHSQLKKGASFEKLAKEKSIGRNAKTGGDIGFVIVNTNVFPEEVEKTIFKLKDNQISEPIKTREGYAVFKAIERKALSEKELESKKNYLKFKLSKEKTDRITNSLLESLRTKAKVKIFDKNLKKIEESKEQDPELLKIKLAEINGKPISLNDLIGNQANYGNPMNSPLFKNPSFLKNMIEENIRSVLFTEEAKRIGMDQDPSFKKKLEILADGIIASKYAMDVLCKDIKATEKEYRQYYEKHKTDPQFQNIPERIKVKHILVNDVKLADDILKRLNKGEDFAKLAKEFSIDRMSADKGGELGYIQRGRMDYLFEEAAFSLKKGEIKQIERNNYGGGGKAYDIISVIDKKPAGANKFEDVKDIIEPTILYKKREQKITEHIEKLRAKAKIKKDINLVNSKPPGKSSPPVPSAPMI